MSMPRRQRLLLVALAGAWSCALAWHPAHAAPPLSKLAPQLTRASDAGASAKAPATAGAMHLPQSRLDLAAPTAAAYERPAAATFAFAPRQGLGGDAAAALPTLGAASPGRLMSRPEVLARNFKREGLPVARLFQSENSLVHVGLSPKGKPGLWFIEKLH